jgi:hypothetical protein
VSFINLIQGRSQNYENRSLVLSCLSVRLSIRPSACKTSAPSWQIFMKFGRGVFFGKYVGKIKVSWNSYKTSGIYIKINLHFLSYRTELFLQWEICQKRVCKENQNIFCVQKYFFFRKSCCVWDNVEKYGTAGQAACDIWYCKCPLHAE